MPDTEMSEEINCRAGNVAGSGLQTAENDRRKCVRLWNTSQSGEVAGRLLSTGPVLQRTQD